VKGRLTTSGYTLAITDNGLGMTADDLARANRRLAGHESFTVAPSRYLGHYVAGHLASRLGVVVELQDSPAGGVTARIDVPMGLLADDELIRTPASAPEEPSEDVLPAGPITSTAPTETTPSGLPRRGERPQPLVVPAAAEAPEPPVPAASPLAASPPPEPLVPSAPAPTSSAPPAPAPAAGFGGLAMAPRARRCSPSPPARHARRTGRQRRAGPGLDPRPTIWAGTGVTDPQPRAAWLAGARAQRPDATVVRAPEPTDVEPTRTTPEDVYSFLSSFQSGVARGMARRRQRRPCEQRGGRR
jgi:hypothetical protein